MCTSKLGKGSPTLSTSRLMVKLSFTGVYVEEINIGLINKTMSILLIARRQCSYKLGCFAVQKVEDVSYLGLLARVVVSAR